MVVGLPHHWLRASHSQHNQLLCYLLSCSSASCQTVILGKESRILGASGSHDRESIAGPLSCLEPPMSVLSIFECPGNKTAEETDRHCNSVITQPPPQQNTSGAVSSECSSIEMKIFTET